MCVPNFWYLSLGDVCMGSNKDLPLHPYIIGSLKSVRGIERRTALIEPQYRELKSKE